MCYHVTLFVDGPLMLKSLNRPKTALKLTTLIALEVAHGLGLVVDAIAHQPLLAGVIGGAIWFTVWPLFPFPPALKYFRIFF